MKKLTKKARREEKIEKVVKKKIEREHRIFNEYKKMPKLHGTSGSIGEDKCRKMGIIRPSEMLQKGKTLRIFLTFTF